MSSPNFVPNPLAEQNAQALARISQISQQNQKNLNPVAQMDAQSAESGMPVPNQDYMRTLASVYNYHEARRQAAFQKIGQYDQMTKAGFMVSGKDWQKAYKQAGIHIDTSPEGIQHAVSFFKQYQAEKDPVTQEQQQMPPEIAAMMEKAQNGQLSKHDVTRFVTGAAIQSEMRSDRWARADQLQKEQFQRKTMQWLSTATDDNASPLEKGRAIANLSVALPDTYGKMMQQTRDFALMTPQQRQMEVGIAAGEESQKDRIERSDRLFDSYVSMGMNAQQARQAADATAEGKPLPAGVKLPSVTPQNLGMALQTATLGYNLGLSGDMLSNFTHLATSKGVDAAMASLPKGFQTRADKELQIQLADMGFKQQGLELQKQQLGIEQYDAMTRRMGVEATAQEKEAQAKLLGLNLQNDRDKILLDQFAILDKMKKQGGNAGELQQQLLNAIASESGMKVERVTHLFGLYSGYKFTPSEVDTSQYAGSSQTGGSGKDYSKQTVKQPSATSKILGGLVRTVGPAVESMMPKPKEKGSD